MFFSSTLVELHVNVHCLDDFLYLLDGRLPQLHTLFVQVVHIDSFFSFNYYEESKLLNRTIIIRICLYVSIF